MYELFLETRFPCVVAFFQKVTILIRSAWSQDKPEPVVILRRLKKITLNLNHLNLLEEISYFTEIILLFYSYNLSLQADVHSPDPITISPPYSAPPINPYYKQIFFGH